MKKIIRWLADVSGVTVEIQNDESKFIGGRLIQNAYWFTGGMMYTEGLHDIANFCVLYGEKLKQGYSYPDISSLRDDLYKMKEQGLQVFKDREVYGYWSNDNSPHFIEKAFYKGEEGYEARLRIKWNYDK